MNPDDFRRLVAAGLSTDQIATVMEMFSERDEARLEAQRARTARYWERMDVSRSEWDGLRSIVFRRDGLVCRYCGDIGGPFEVDHIHPVSRGGTSTPSNLCVACAPCNASKRDKLVEEWIR